MLTDFISLIYPKTCLNCNSTLLSNEQYICLSCKLALPFTHDHQHPDNELYQKFAFEPKIKSASAYLYFHRGGIAQKLLYQLKYEGKKEIGEVIGAWYGEEIKKYLLPDIILPVPIHDSKQKKRGYNQSLHFAKGLVTVFEKACVDETLVKRLVRTQTQTRKSKVERWENLTNVYSEISTDLSSSSILVVDDVITTGATVGMLCERLVQANAKSIHIACIARGK